MNAEEVCAMMNAISEGRYYAHGFETKRDIITIEVGTNSESAPNEFWFSSFTPGANFLAKIDDPRTAREIAAALVAWADRKEGEVTTNIFYTRDDSSTRHYVTLNRMTLPKETVCGRLAFKSEPLALPVNCNECLTGNSVKPENPPV